MRHKFRVYTTRLAKWWREFKCRHDMHDYPDSDIALPLHFYTYTCRHCGKEFQI